LMKTLVGVIFLAGLIMLLFSILSKPELKKFVDINFLKDEAGRMQSRVESEQRNCGDFISLGYGTMAAWEQAGEGLKAIRFCQDYQSCVIGCAMYLKLVDAGTSGNMTQGIYAINRKFGDVYGIHMSPNDFRYNGEAFNRFAEDDFVLKNAVAEAVLEQVGKLKLPGGAP